MADVLCPCCSFQGFGSGGGLVPAQSQLASMNRGPGQPMNAAVPANMGQGMKMSLAPMLQVHTILTS